LVSFMAPPSVPGVFSNSLSFAALLSNLCAMFENIIYSVG
jgi:hypothetical protein